LSEPSASGESVDSSCVDGAFLSCSVESLDDLSSSEVESASSVFPDSSSPASDESSVGLAIDGASSSVSDESLHDSSSEVPADSLSSFALGPD